jgi:hypothetical protein
MNLDVFELQDNNGYDRKRDQNASSPDGSGKAKSFEVFNRVYNINCPDTLMRFGPFSGRAYMATSRLVPLCIIRSLDQVPPR